MHGSLVANECLQLRIALPVYNMVPFQGVPSMVAFPTEAGPTFIVGSLSPVDQHVTFTISDIHPPSSTSPPIIESRLVFFSAQETNLNPFADGTYLTMRLSNCAGGQVSVLHLDTQGEPYEEEEAIQHRSELHDADRCDRVRKRSLQTGNQRHRRWGESS